MKKKSVSIIITSVVLIAVVAAGMTLAFLQASTDAKTNAFSSNKKIDIQLREPQWDGYEFGSETVGDGSTSARPEDTSLGMNQAQIYIPGQVIAKDPTVKNTGDKDSIDAYVGMRVRYYKTENGQKTQLSYDNFKNTFLNETGIAFDANWTELSNTSSKNTNDQVFVYGTKASDVLKATVLEKGKTTSALFTEVPLSPALVGDAAGLSPQFSIEVQAFALQTVAVDNVEVEMLKFINAN